MNMIIILHVVHHGGGISERPFSSNWCIGWLWFLISVCAVNCFGILSGYVGLGQRHKLSTIFNWCFIASFYSIVISLIFYKFVLSSVSIGAIFKSFFPYIFKHNWYFISYFVVYFFMPYIDKMIYALKDEELKRILLYILILFCILPTLFQKDLYSTGNGFTPFWLALLYIVGASLKKLKVNNSTFVHAWCKHSNLVYAMCLLCLIALKFLFMFISSSSPNIIIKNLFAQWGWYISSYPSPLVICISVSLLFLLEKIQVSCVFQRLLCFLVPMNFSVLFIHAHPLIYDVYVKDCLKPILNFNVFSFFVLIPFICIIIYCLCIFIDSLREKVFRHLRIYNLCLYMEQSMSALFQENQTN